MKKCKSTSMLRLGSSRRKQSSFNPILNNVPLRMLPSRSSSSLLRKHYNHQNQQSSDSASNLAPSTPHSQQKQKQQQHKNRPTTILKAALTNLHEKIDRLETQISQNRGTGKNKGKDYQQQLQQYEQLGHKLRDKQLQKHQAEQKVKQTQNNIWMLQEDYRSAKMNLEQVLAERQYCDEIIGQYQREYDGEGTLLMELLQAEGELQAKKGLIGDLGQQLKKKEKALSEWRDEIGYELQEKVMRNKVTNLRIQLMKAEEELNVYADKQKLPKIRQILCSLIRSHAETNKIIIYSQQLNEQSMQIYACRHDLCEEYQQSVVEYRGKDKQKYDHQVVEQYFSVLAKINAKVNDPKTKLEKKINQQYIDEIKQIRIEIIDSEEKVKNLQNKIVQLNQNMQIALTNQSVAVIEHHRESTGRYEINLIKVILKNLKVQQKNRIKKIRQVYKMYQNPQTNLRKMEDVTFMNKLDELNKQLYAKKLLLKSIHSEFKKIQQEKQRLEDSLNMAVSGWVDISSKKEELKKMYRNLAELNREIREAQKMVFQQRTASKSNSFLIPHKKSSTFALSSALKETAKLRINGLQKNKQNKENLQKGWNKIGTFNRKQSLTIDDGTKTRKQSLHNYKTTKQDYGSARDSLTVVLMSKFGK